TDCLEVVPTTNEAVHVRRKIAPRASRRRHHWRVLTPTKRHRRHRWQTSKVQLTQRHKIVATRRTHQPPDSLRTKDLPTHRCTAQPRCLKARHAVIIARPLGDIPCADADPYLEGDLRAFIASRHHELNLCRRRDRIPSPPKHRHVPVAGVLNEVAVM